ncbi:NAD-dependent epimerase/dehydratase [Methylobacterium sp. 4-46]|uniref:NAD-dependent epimerase/dehydratase family protein n=1 Tax=unclassified Methylobacterium TaxID=2615210 RepID=UPI000152E993|nr:MULTISPECIES: NAD-dependent epimerase/dehydratase family protein [Methylobacterium]ACA19513.1 NAD-dependent epimerase/dehydratase [Methylobacterium sp. 4-46]WFT78709.1 GDP-mannose 4,6-dehydratase [Methylobacterium nodulans]
MKRILITGATGFVGRHAAAAFLDRFGAGAEIVGLGREARPAALSAGIGYVAADLSDGRRTAECLREVAPTDILHLAALSSVSDAAARPVRAWSENVGTVLSLASALVDHLPGTNLFFVSSGEVYGRAFLSGQPVGEAVRPEPASTYAKTKLVGEQILTDVLGRAGSRLVILRPLNHIGPGQSERFVVASFAAQIARIEAQLVPPVLEVGDLSARRDFLDVRDVVEAYAGLVAAADTLDRCSIFNIASGQARSIGSLLETLASLSRRPFEVRVAQERLRPSEIPTACGDASALAARTGWAPKRSLTETLASVLDHARAEVRHG